MQQCWSYSFSESLQGELRWAIKCIERCSNNPKMAAVVDDMTTLPCFHTWQHSLNQPQGAKVVHLEQVFCHVDRCAFQYRKNPDPSIVNWMDENKLTIIPPSIPPFFYSLVLSFIPSLHDHSVVLPYYLNTAHKICYVMTAVFLACSVLVWRFKARQITSNPSSG